MSFSIRRPVAKKKLSETVAEELERIIRQGELAEGDPLPSERELMDTFGVGRPSIRDALSALARKGLVKISSGERTRVTKPTAQHIFSELSGLSKDFLARPNGGKYFDQLRLFFESSLVRYAAEYATSEQLEKLRAALELNQRSLGNPEQFRKTDMNFHRAIAEMPGNPIFIAVHQALVDWVISERPTLSEASQDELELISFKSHTELYERLSKRDIAGADRVLREHLQYVYDNYYE